MKRTTVLRQAIMQRRAVVVPGCHDALSAKAIDATGFEAIQISGYGLAASLLGKPDVGLVQMKDILDLSWNIAQAVRIPVMADVDTGGGNAINAAEITGRLIAMGLAGMNIEDQVFPKRCGHMAGKEVISAEEMAGKVRACAQVRAQLDPDFVLNARTDAFAVSGLDEAIRRCNLYLEAGADLAFIDGIKTRADIEKAVAAVRGPLSVNLMDAISGMKTELVPIPELATLTAFFTALRESPSGILPGQTQWVSSFEEFTDFVGLKEYKKMEEELLPQRRLDAKYAGQQKIVG
jgi:2-methylisocitrate lyase-like PEP mutase family enzyme